MSTHIETSWSRLAGWALPCPARVVACGNDAGHDGVGWLFLGNGL